MLFKLIKLWHNGEQADRTCTTLAAACRAGEFEKTKATLKSDRVCEACKKGTVDDDEDPTTPCAECADSTYQDLDGQIKCRFSDLRCAAGKYEVAKSNSTSPRMCRPCDGKTEFQDEADQKKCKAVSKCENGTKVVGEPTAKTDRKCEACDGILEYQDKEMQAFCLNIRPTCGFGTFESVAASAATDRVCTPCAEGTYQDEANQEECKPVTKCLAGTKQLTLPSTFADRQCVACDGIRFYQDQNASLVCKPTTQCQANQFVQVAATPSSDNECRDLFKCDEGTISSGNLTESGDRLCKSHNECLEDEYEFKAPSADSDRVCGKIRVCKTGMYEFEKPTNNSDRLCETCKSCGRGEYTKEECTATSNTVCAVCTDCQEGVSFLESKCSATEDAVCSTCTTCTMKDVKIKGVKHKVGDFYQERCNVEADAKCTACTQCEAHEYEASQCSEDVDTVCKARCGYEETVANGSGNDNFSGSGEPVVAPPTEPVFAWNDAVFTDATDGSCQAVTPCTATQFQKSPATPMANTNCKDIRVCTDEEFETQPASATSDRYCKLARVCDDSVEYETVAKTEFANRKCAALTEVAEYQYVSVNRTATSDRQVTNKTLCARKQHTVTDGSAYADRVCADRPLCETSYNGSYIQFNYQKIYIQPANESVPCLNPLEEEEPVNTIGPDTEASAQNAAASSGGLDSGEAGAIVVVLLCFFAVVAAVLVAYSKPREQKLRPEGVMEEENKLSAGVVSEDKPFEKGDFWALEENDTEIRPMTLSFTRKDLPPKPKDAHDYLDSEMDTDDEDVAAGEYNIAMGGLGALSGESADDGSGMVKLLSQNHQQMMPPMTPISPGVGMYPPGTPMAYGGMPNGVLINQSYAPLSPGGMAPPSLDMSSASLPGIAMAGLSVMAGNGVGTMSPGAEDEEDTKL